MDSSKSRGEDLARTLVRSVIRAFYETRDILIVDALVIHSALRDDDLAYLMSMNTKDLHKVCAKLRDDRFLVVHTRSELREGQSRPVNRTYYYIDYRQTIDAIKWRVYKITKDVQGVTVPQSERKEYFCGFCKSEWTQMEVLDNFGPRGFLCHKCGHVLTHDLERNSVGHQKSTRLNNQIRFISDLLPEIDRVSIPEFTFDKAIERARPVERDEQHRVASSIAVDSQLRPTAVKGLQDTGPKVIQVSIQTEEGKTEEEVAAERERRERAAKQNALPAWMTQSTITGESYGGGQPAAAGALTLPKEDETKDVAMQKAQDAKDHAEIDDYFAKLKAEAEAEAARKAAEMDEEASDDEDEGDFEDVVGTSTGSGGATPARIGSSAPVVPSPLRQSSGPPGNLKREASASATSTDASTPGSDSRAIKRVKVEEPAPPAVKADDDDDDDIEFEDAF